MRLRKSGLVDFQIGHKLKIGGDGKSHLRNKRAGTSGRQGN